MSRLFITPRELDFISDITKEVTKDIIGQKIYYYRVREDLSKVHDVYEESKEKIFDSPIEVDALVQWQPETVTTGKFGSEEVSSIEVYLHDSDLKTKNINVLEGDFFSYGEIFFEITSILVDKNMFGQVEHITGVKLTGKKARKGQINLLPLGPTQDSPQTEFDQQRGESEINDLETGDKRSLVESGKLGPPLEGPRKVKDQENDLGNTESFFYGNEEE